MKDTLFSSVIRRPALFGTIVFLAVVLLTQYVGYQRYLIEENNKEEQLMREIGFVKDRLQTTLSYNLSAAKTLAFIIKKYGVPEDFNNVARDILNSNKNIDALQLSRGGIITHVYPLEGNEAAIGYDVLSDSMRNIEAFKAIEKRELFFAGPFELKQGGVGIVGRLPVFINDRFWGFSTVIVRLSTLIKALGTDTSGKGPFIYQLSKVNPNTRHEEFFFSSPADPSLYKATSVKVPDGEWNIYVMHRHHKGLSGVITFSAIGLILSLICGLFAWFLAKQPQKLDQLVREKTLQIRIAEDHIATTLERVSDAFVALDRNWRYVFLNDGALAHHPDGREGTLGRVIWDVHPQMKGTVFWYKYHEAMETGRVVEVESYYEPMNTWFSVSVYPSPDGLTIFYRDITSTKRAEQEILNEKNLSVSIINSLPGIFYLYDRKGKFVRWNKNFETVSGYTAEEISQMHPLDFFDDDEKELVNQRIGQVFELGVSEVEAHFFTKDKRRIPYYFNGHKTAFNQVDYLVGVGIDITERKQGELEREKVTYDLIQRNKNMEQFAYIVSHNLRAPLTNILGLTELLNTPGTDLNEMQMGIKGLSVASHKLDDVIKDLNEILQVRTQIFEKKEYVYFEEIVRSISVSIGNVISNQQVEIRTDFSAADKMLSVRAYMYSIFYNLIYNSIKYKKPGEGVLIEVKSSMTPKGIQLTFSDNGMGIDIKKHAEKLFGLYKRFHLQTEGKGLGLFMVKTQVETLGGEIEVSSEVNKGTVFTIRFNSEEPGSLSSAVQ